MRPPAWAKVQWWFLNLEFGPWGSSTPPKPWTWRVRWPKP